MPSQIREGYNFQNVSVNYRYGAEISEPIPEFSQPTNQKQIDFSLLGKTDPGASFTDTRVVAEPLFEEFDEIDSDNSFFANDLSDVTLIEKTKVLRLTGLNIINFGNGYSTNTHPVKLTFSNLGEPLTSGGLGVIYEQPILDITTVNGGGIGSFSIIDGGRFEGASFVEAYEGEQFFYTRSGSGFLGNELATPAGNWQYDSGVVTGTGLLSYRETIDGVIAPNPITGIGTFSGVVTRVENRDVFAGRFIQETPYAQSIEIALETSDDNEFIFSITGSDFYPENLVFSQAGIEPSYTISSSDAVNTQNQDDIRHGSSFAGRPGTNYSNWNQLAEDPIDRQAYTHLIKNSNVTSVSAILDIKALGDQLSKADQTYKVTEKPNWYGGGDLEVDFAFRIGNPIDNFITVKYEWGFLGTNEYELAQATYRGQTIGGYLVKSNDFDFKSYKYLKDSSPQYSDLTIDQLKSSFPRYIRVSKDMYETNSSLIQRRISLHAINEQFDTTYSYPSSAIVATKMNSTYFDNIPTRTYDVKLKKVWVPEVYDIQHSTEDKRFRRKDEVEYDPSKLPYYDPTEVFNRFTASINRSSSTSSIAISNDRLFVGQRDYGSNISSALADNDYGNIFVYQNMGRGINHAVSNDYQMIRDGIPKTTSLVIITTGPGGSANRFPLFDVVKNNAVVSVNAITNPLRYVIAETKTVLLTYINVRRLYTGVPLAWTHSLFLRVSPKKSARLTCSFTTVSIPSGSMSRLEFADYGYRYLSAIAGAVVIGTVRDINAEAPETVLRTLYASSNSSGSTVGTVFDGDVIINNTYDTDYLWVKFFTAQHREILSRFIGTPYGFVSYLYLGRPIDLLYTSGVHPDSVRIGNTEMIDLSMKDYFMDTEPRVSESQGDYFIHSMMKNSRALGVGGANGGQILLIFKLDSNGFWYPHQEIERRNDRGTLLEARAVKFFPSQDRFAVLWDDVDAIEIHKATNSFFSLEYSIPDFQGIFEGIEVHGLISNSASSCCVVNDKTIIVSRNCKIREAPAAKNELDGWSSRSKNVFVYRLDDLNDKWSLDEIILPPEYKNSIAQYNINIAAIDEWLIISGKDYDGSPWGSTDIGAVMLFRFNGKKYEFIRKFTSDALRNFFQSTDGAPIGLNFDTNFGDYIGLTVDDNNDPVILATASREETTHNGDGHVYIFSVKPNSDEWVHKKMNFGPGLDINPDSNENFPHFAFDGKHVAFQLEVPYVNRTDGLTDRVGVFSILPPEKTTRVIAGENWFGMMKKAWSDNPVWIIYDLLTNPIYGAGSVLDDLKDINIFDFFEVAKYLDSIDKHGYYLPIYDERGHTEPRLSCNFLLDNDFNAFEVISSICDLFFGAVYIKEGKYNIWADKPTAPSWYFNNRDVLDGNFSYSDTAKWNRPSIIEVPYLDKYDGFKDKVEFIEDSELMRKNGKNQVKLDFATFTTRSQARRFGKHYLYNKSYETEKIKFLTDSKALFLSPGDIVGVDDELKSFKSEKLFYEVEDVGHIEKVYAVNNSIEPTQYSSANPDSQKFTFSEITFNNCNTEDFDVKSITKELSDGVNQSFYNHSISIDNDKVPHVISSIKNGSLAIYKKNGEDFDEVLFLEGSSYSNTDENVNNLTFDSYNTPYFSFIQGGNTEPTITFSKLTGSDFTNSGHWQFTQLENLDAASEGFQPTDNPSLKSIIKINSNNEKYILTARFDISPKSGEYILFHNNGIDDDTNPNNWDRYIVDAYYAGAGNDANDVDFDMQLTDGGKPAIVYSKSIDQNTYRSQLRYKEFVGNSLGNEADWSGLFVQGDAPDASRTNNFSLRFDGSGIPYITHLWEQGPSENNQHILSPLSYEGRFVYDNWADNSKFMRYRGADNKEKMSLHFLQNGNAIIFTASYDFVSSYLQNSSIQAKRSLQFEESSDPKGWGQYHNWNKQTIYKTDIFAGGSSDSVGPSTVYDFEDCTIILKNLDSLIYDDPFSIDTSIKNNLEITKLFNQDLTGLYNETRFENFSSKVKQQIISEPSFITITGFETSGNYIKLFAEKSTANSKVIGELSVDKPMVRPIKAVENKYKEYRIINVSEKEQNLYEVEAKEYFSGKFDIIDTFASIIEPEQAEYNIGLPTNEVIRPPAPVGVATGVGIDGAGSPFLTGIITGEPNGSETEYRMSLMYPNGRTVVKEIEKDTDNLSPSNEFLTNFGFYNLALAGDYDLHTKSLRNPESSVFIDQKFTISEMKDAVSSHPFVNDINLLVNENLLKIKIKAKDVYGDNLNLFDSNCSINLIIEGETYVENSKVTDFEISFQQIKDLTNSSLREKEIKAQLIHNEIVISEESKILRDEAPEMKSVNFISDGLTASIVAEVEESEKLISLDMRTGEITIKTFAIENQNKLQTFRLEDFEISELPKNQKIDFNFVPRDFYGTGKSLNCESYIPEKESVLQKYNNSIIGIYSIYSEDAISTGFSNYESSNSRSGFYGNGEDCLVEFSSSLLSGQSASLNLELVSDTESDTVSLEFQDKGFLSSKKVMNLSQKYYNVRVSGESGLFGGFDLKIKKLV